MKRLALTIALACAVSGVARAGEIHPTGVAAPPPPSTTATTGEIPTSDVAGEIPGTGVIGEIHTTGATAPLTIILTIISIVP